MNKRHTKRERGRKGLERQEPPVNTETLKSHKAQSEREKERDYSNDSIGDRCLQCDVCDYLIQFNALERLFGGLISKQTHSR